jgi:hypothetical protein
VPGTTSQQVSYPWQSDFGSKHWLEVSDPRIASVPRIHHHPQEMWVTLPHWFLVALCAMFSAFPWIPIRRFSLRTMLVATTLVAVVLGLIVIAFR